MNAGIRDILIISTSQDALRFEELLDDGHQFGIKLSYTVQPSPDGFAQAFIIGADFIGNDYETMVLDDNIFFGHGLKKRLKAAVKNAENGNGATVFGYYVDDPERFGIVEFDEHGRAVSIEEKQNIRRAVLRDGSVFLRKPCCGVCENLTKFEDGIKKTIQWYLDNKEWCQTVISGEYQNYYEKMYENSGQTEF